MFFPSDKSCMHLQSGDLITVLLSAKEVNWADKDFMANCLHCHLDR